MIRVSIVDAPKFMAEAPSWSRRNHWLRRMASWAFAAASSGMDATTTKGATEIAQITRATNAKVTPAVADAIAGTGSVTSATRPPRTSPRCKGPRVRTSGASAGFSWRTCDALRRLLCLGGASVGSFPRPLWGVCWHLWALWSLCDISLPSGCEAICGLFGGLCRPLWGFLWPLWVSGVPPPHLHRTVCGCLWALRRLCWSLRGLCGASAIPLRHSFCWASCLGLGGPRWAFFYERGRGLGIASAEHERFPFASTATRQ